MKNDVEKEIKWQYQVINQNNLNHFIQRQDNPFLLDAFFLYIQVKNKKDHKCYFSNKINYSVFA